MNKTAIEWCGWSWNPITGCRDEGQRCFSFCYARRMALRMAGRFGYNREDPFAITEHGDRWKEPFLKKGSTDIFVCSMGDLFSYGVPSVAQNRVFNTILDVERHRFLILTKRPKRARKAYDDWFNLTFRVGIFPELMLPQNLWMGASIIDQRTLEDTVDSWEGWGYPRVYLSLEPLLEDIDLSLLQKIKNIQLIIVGGMTGISAKEHISFEMARKIKNYCSDHAICFFFKKQGGKNKKIGTPSDLNLRELPWK